MPLFTPVFDALKQDLDGEWFVTSIERRWFWQRRRYSVRKFDWETGGYELVGNLSRKEAEALCKLLNAAEGNTV